jgi:hypothetical protein
MARLTFVGLVTAFSLFAMVPSAKAASISSCGNINVEASAQCKVDTGLACEAECTPVSCSADLYVGCKGGCQLTLPSCETSCKANCTGKCTANANFDCTGTCNLDCEGTCTGNCQTQCGTNNTGANCQAECEGSCKATCHGECDASCSASASADCTGQCNASCTGSCNGQARLSCQATCQASGYADCTGGCKLNCERTGQGGLFCDGQFVDDGGYLQDCINAIEQELPTITVDASATGSCSGNSCQGEAKASASCALARLGENKGLTGSLIMLAAAGLIVGVRRRRSQ